MVEFESQSHNSGSGKDLLLFLPCAISDLRVGGFFTYQACYLLEASLRAEPAIDAAWDIEVLPFRPPASSPMFHGDRLWERVIYDILSRRPRVVAFSLFGWSFEHSRRVAQALRIMAPDILLVAGGPDVVDREELAPRWATFDVLIEGDGEVPLAALLRRLAAGDDPGDIPGLSWKGPGGWRHAQVRRGGHGEYIPDYFTPNHELLAGQAYYKYCMWATQGFRRKGADQVLTELRAILGSVAVRSVSFFDYDLLGIYQEAPEVLEQILEVLRSRPEVDFSFFTKAGGLGRPELRTLTTELRLNQISVGIQSMNPDALAAVNRGWGAEDLVGLETMPRDLRRHAVMELMYPLPEETPESFFSGLDRLVRLGYSRFQIFPLVVLRGTALYQEAARWGLRFMESWPNHALETATFPAVAMREAQGVSWLLSLLNELNCRSQEDIEALERHVHATPGLVDALRARVRDGEALDRIFGDIMADIHGEAFVGSDAVSDFLTVSWWRDIAGARVAKAALSGAGQRSGPSSVAPMDRAAFPPGDELVGLLARSGAVVLEEILGEGMLGLRSRHRGADVEIQIFGAEDPRQHYKVAGRYKVAYTGTLEDIGILDELVRYLKEVP